MPIVVLICPPYISMRSSWLVVFFFFFLEEKVEGMDKNDSDINLGAGTVYGKSWVRGSGKPISKTVQGVL